MTSNRTASTSGIVVTMIRRGIVVAIASLCAVASTGVAATASQSHQASHSTRVVYTSATVTGDTADLVLTCPRHFRAVSGRVTSAVLANGKTYGGYTIVYSGPDILNGGSRVRQWFIKTNQSSTSGEIAVSYTASATCARIHG